VPDWTPRPVCYRCHKPQVTCICSGLQRVPNRTEVLVLQHPRERLHPIGTARFAQLGLERSRVEVAWNAGAHETSPPAWIPSGTALLYPTPDARDLRAVPPDELPRQLLVLDGTWNTARTLYRDKLWLHTLPHYRFLPSAPGRYRLRREPQHDYVSTIEAIVEALRILEPTTRGLDALLAAFDAMIDRQIAYVGSDTSAPRTRSRRRPAAQRRVPHALVEGFSRVVVVYGEPSRPVREQDREFVYFSAISLGDRTGFERVMMPLGGLPDPIHLGHMGLTAADFTGAATGACFAEEWRAFLGRCGPEPLVAAWNQRTLDLLARCTDLPASRLTLKGAYRSLHGCDAEDLEQVITRHGLALTPNTLRGRAARRLAGAVATAEFLHAGTS
jgi:DTW domain-containing protein